IAITTTMNDGSGYAATMKIYFSTTNFTTFQKWITDITATAGFAITNLNSSGQYIYKNNQNGKTVFVGLDATYVSTGGAPGKTAQNMQASTPLRYYCYIAY